MRGPVRKPGDPTGCRPPHIDHDEPARPPRQHRRVRGQQPVAAGARGPEEGHVDVPLEVEAGRGPPRGVAEREALRRYAEAMPLRDAGRADVEHRAGRPRQRLVPVEEARSGLLGADRDRPLHQVRRRGDAAAQGGPLVRRDERVHAPGKRLGEALDRHARLHAERGQLVARHLNDLAEVRSGADAARRRSRPRRRYFQSRRRRDRGYGADVEPRSDVLVHRGRRCDDDRLSPDHLLPRGHGRTYAIGDLDGSGGHYTWMTATAGWNGSPAQLLDGLLLFFMLSAPRVGALRGGVGRGSPAAAAPSLLA